MAAPTLEARAHSGPSYTTLLDSTEVTACQWGMVTSARASMHRITRLDLSRLAADGQLERLAHGVYKDAGAPAGPYDDLKAAWLSTDPKSMGEARIKDLANGVVVAGESAADLHSIGDLRALRHEFVSSARRQSQRSAIRYRLRTLDPRDVTLVDGLPSPDATRTVRGTRRLWSSRRSALVAFDEEVQVAEILRRGNRSLLCELEKEGGWAISPVGAYAADAAGRACPA